MSDESKHRHGERRAVFCMILHLGAWKKKVPEQQRNIILSEGLNYIIKDKHLKTNVLGYLITRRKVCLIVESMAGHIDETMKAFKGHVSKKIIDYLYHFEYSDTTEKKIEKRTHRLMIDLFTERPLYNNNLMRLITGRELNIKYYSPHIAKLEDLISNYDYCSAFDYSGAKGPVWIALKSKWFWEQELETIKKINPLWVEYLIK